MKIEGILTLQSAQLLHVRVVAADSGSLILEAGVQNITCVSHSEILLFGTFLQASRPRNLRQLFPDRSLLAR